MLLDLLLIFCIGFVQTNDFTVEIGDRFTVRTDGSNRYSNPDVRAIAISPDGSEITVATNHSMMFIRSTDGELIGTKKETPFALVYSVDGSRIYSISSRGSKLIRVSDKSEMATTLNRPKGYVGLKLKEKGGKIIVSQADVGSPAATNEKLTIGSELVGFADGLSDDIRSIVNQELKEVYKKLDGAAGSEFRLTFVPRGKIEEEEITLRRRMIESTADGPTFIDFTPNDSNDTTLWCMAKGFHEIRSSVDGSFISSFSFKDFSGRAGAPRVSPSGKLFAWVAKYEDAENAKYAIIGDALKRRRERKKLEDGVVGIKTDSLGYSRGDENFYGVEIRNVFTKELVATFPVGKDPKHNGGQLFRGVHIDSDDKTLVITTHTCLHVYDIETGKRLRIVKFVPVSSAISLNCSAISGRLGAAGDSKGIVRVVDLETGDTLQTIKGREKGDVTHMEFSKNASVLSYHVDGVIHVVNLVIK